MDGLMRRGKRLLCLLLALAILCGCSAAPPETDRSAGELAGAVLTALGRDPADLERLDETLGPEGLPGYLTDFYGLEPDGWEDCAIYRAGGVEVLEVAVLHLTGDAEDALPGLADYIAARQGDFTGYAPEQAAIAAQGRAVAQGRYAALLLCENAAEAQTAFLACLDGENAVSAEGTSVPEPRSGGPVTYPGRYPFTPPGTDDMTLYDTSAILAAWAGGDAGTLSEKDEAILDMAGQVLAEILTEDMTDYEKERAVYAWVTSHVTYDMDHYDPLAQMDPDSYNPYGPLKHGKGVCLGFASVFQLLMDMAGVECLTVAGAAYSSREDHAWNMVRLDGSWYCADATWDAGGREREWRFFNVSGKRMAGTDHQWDYGAVPEAAGEYAP